jgi:voltage-gated potassium channel
MFKTPTEQKAELGRRLLILFFLITFLLGIGTLVYHITEGWGYVDSLYFSTISLTSRGYSELHPTKLSSILFSVLYLLIGVAVLVYGLSTTLAFYTAFYQTKIENKVHNLVDRITHNDKKRWISMKPRDR